MTLKEYLVESPSRSLEDFSASTSHESSEHRLANPPPPPPGVSFPPPAPPCPPLAPPCPPRAPPCPPRAPPCVPLAPLLPPGAPSPPPTLEGSCASSPPSQAGNLPKSAKISPAALKGVKSNEIVTLSSEEMVSLALKRFCNFNSEYQYHKKDVVNHATQPQLQEGPQCGLVAVSMASQLVGEGKHVTPNVLFEFAKEHGFTKKGEMFSTENLVQLCQTFIPNADFEICSVDVINKSVDVVQDFLSRHIYIIPYDCDFSHGPCLEQGRKAHWALLTGCVVLSREVPGSGQFDWLSSQYHNIDQHYLDNKTVMLLGRQSKSLVLGVWDPEELIASNRNLRIVDDKRSEQEYVIPEEGLQNSLANKIIRMKING